jgi:phenylpropionate dioxygenase-like ring-hydroxylating dioxygenase large terminal subunit
MRLEDFWYIAAESRELKAGKPLARSVLGEWLVLWRAPDGRALAYQDRCLHRGSRLSRGAVKDGCLRCPYHGWSYGSQGEVCDIPSEGPGAGGRIRKRLQGYSVKEQQGYVYVRLAETPEEEIEPRSLPFHGEKGWGRIRLVNRFRNSVPRCAENFLDIPHTVFVHPGIFRNRRSQRFTAKVERAAGSVRVEYGGETDNFGIFSKILNPSGREIGHTDSFHFPNLTQVEYRFGTKRRFFITSHCTPTGEGETVVYTDLAYHYGWMNLLAGPVIRWQGQAIIDQDVEVLNSQGDTARKYGEEFIPMPADTIHLYIDSIWKELEEGRDPRLLPEKRAQVGFHA